MIFTILQRVRRAAEGSGIGRLPGVAWMYTMVFRSVKPRGITRIKTKNFPLFVNAEGGGLHRTLLEQGVYEPDTEAVMKSLLKPGMTVVDIGSNIGYFSILCAHLVGSSGKVICFEPAQENVYLLHRNIDLNGLRDRMIVVPSCLGDKETTVTLHLDSTNQGNHSLAAGNIVQEKDAVSVECTTLDAYVAKSSVPRIDLIKMDVQGAELQVLNGATKTLAANPSMKMIIEFWPFGLRNASADPQKVVQILRDAGFHFRDMEALHEPIDHLSNEQLIARCDAKRSGKGWMNLLVEK